MWMLIKNLRTLQGRKQILYEFNIAFSFPNLERNQILQIQFSNNVVRNIILF